MFCGASGGGGGVGDERRRLAEEEEQERLRLAEEKAAAEAAEAVEATATDSIEAAKDALEVATNDTNFLDAAVETTNNAKAAEEAAEEAAAEAEDTATETAAKAADAADAAADEFVDTVVGSVTDVTASSAAVGGAQYAVVSKDIQNAKDTQSNNSVKVQALASTDASKSTTKKTDSFASEFNIVKRMIIGQAHLDNQFIPPYAINSFARAGNYYSRAAYAYQMAAQCATKVKGVTEKNKFDRWVLAGYMATVAGDRSIYPGCMPSDHKLSADNYQLAVEMYRNASHCKVDKIDTDYYANRCKTLEDRVTYELQKAATHASYAQEHYNHMLQNIDYAFLFS
jgi:chemotaxis protein histidine kinase CheA